MAIGKDKIRRSITLRKSTYKQVEIEAKRLNLHAVSLIAKLIEEKYGISDEEPPAET